MMFSNKKSTDKSEIKKNIQSILNENLNFTAIEQYKMLRTNLMFTLPDEEKSHVIGVTSPARAEGKSTTAINLSYSLAEAGKRVLLIDGDLRLPSVSKKLNIRSATGLSQLLFDFDGTNLSLHQPTKLENFSVLPSGAIPPNPSELLSSKRMEKLIEALKEEFEYIIVDLPPVNIVSDAIAVSRLVSGLILVIREDSTERKEFVHCVRQLELSEIKVLGVVMNAIRTAKPSYGKYKKYYKYYRNEYKQF